MGSLSYYFCLFFFLLLVTKSLCVLNQPYGYKDILLYPTQKINIVFALCDVPLVRRKGSIVGDKNSRNFILVYTHFPSTTPVRVTRTLLR